MKWYLACKRKKKEKPLDTHFQTLGSHITRISRSCQYHKSNGCPWTLLYGSLLEFYGPAEVNNFENIAHISSRARGK